MLKHVSGTYFLSMVFKSFKPWLNVSKLNFVGLWNFSNGKNYRIHVLWIIAIYTVVSHGYDIKNITKANWYSILFCRRWTGEYMPYVVLSLFFALSICDVAPWCFIAILQANLRFKKLNTYLRVFAIFFYNNCENVCLFLLDQMLRGLCAYFRTLKQHRCNWRLSFLLQKIRRPDVLMTNFWDSIAKFGDFVSFYHMCS